MQQADAMQIEWQEKPNERNVAEPSDGRFLKEITAEAIVDQLIERIFLRYGAVSFIQSDKGKQFTATLNKEIAEAFLAKGCFSTTYHSQSQGLTERANKSVTSILRRFVNATHTDWDIFVPWAVWH